MKILDVKNLKTARKYANALLESATDAGNTSKVSANLDLILETLKINSELSNFLYSPIVKVEDKKEVIKKIFSSHIEEITLDFLYLLVDNNRLNVIEEIVECYNSENNRIENIVKPVIISAVDLDENQKVRLIEKISSKLSKNIIPEYKTDKEIIGGIIVEIGDKTIDCSLKTKFENMRKQLTKGNRYGSY